MEKKVICYLTRYKIEGEAVRAAAMGLGHMSCRYDGAKREIWLNAYSEAKDES